MSLHSEFEQRANAAIKELAQLRTQDTLLWKWRTTFQVLLENYSDQELLAQMSLILADQRSLEYWQYQYDLGESQLTPEKFEVLGKNLDRLYSRDRMILTEKMLQQLQLLPNFTPLFFS